MLDADLAVLYSVPTKALNQAVKRNERRFPRDFVFRLKKEEKDELVTNCDRFERLKHSYVHLRQMLSANKDLERKLIALEKKYDEQFKVVFDTIRAMMAPIQKPERRI